MYIILPNNKPIENKEGIPMKSIFIIIRRSVYISLGKLNRLLNRGNGNLIVLCYHSVSDNNWRFSVSAKNLEKQIQFLLKNYKIISLKNLYDYINGKINITEPSVVLTFDDGYKNLLEIQDLVKNLNIQPTVFVLSDSKHADRIQLHNKLNFLEKDDIISLKKSGWEIGSHSATHRNFANLTRREIISEVINSKIVLEQQLKTNIKYFSYPKGKYSKSIQLAADIANYELAVCMDNGFVTKNNDLMAIPRIGIDNTHCFEEFKSMLTPTVIDFKRFVTKLGLTKYILVS